MTVPSGPFLVSECFLEMFTRPEGRGSVTSIWEKSFIKGTADAKALRQRQVSRESKEGSVTEADGASSRELRGHGGDLGGRAGHLKDTFPRVPRGLLSGKGVTRRVKRSDFYLGESFWLLLKRILEAQADTGGGVGGRCLYSA